MNEIWKDVIGYKGLYQISNFGRVKSLDRIIQRSDGISYVKKSQILKNRLSNRGYYAVILVDEKSNKKFMSVHRLVAIHFIPTYNYDLVVNHKDGNKINNNVNNLEWVTQLENIEHAHRLGLISKTNRGSKNTNSKLTNEQVVEMYKLAHQGINHKEISNKFGVNPSRVSSIKLGRTWSHITKDIKI